MKRKRKETPLKRLAKRPIYTPAIVRYLDSLRDLQDQAMALVTAVWAERALESAILRRMVKLSRTDKAELLEGMGPLASFGSKIKVAFALGIIGRRGASDLTTIKDIRNQFAHTFHPLTFKTPAIAKACRQLKASEQALSTYGLEVNPRGRNVAKWLFATSCAVIAVTLGGKYIRQSPRKSRDKFSRTFLFP